MISESERELRRQLEEPLSCECRNYPLSGEHALVTLIDTPYYPPYAFDPLHVHNCLEIGFCMAGSGKIRFRGGILPFDVGAVVVMPRGAYHSQKNEGVPMTHWRYLVIDEECLMRRLPEAWRGRTQRLLERAGEGGMLIDGAEYRELSLIVQLMFDLWRNRAEESPPELELGMLLILSLLGGMTEPPQLFAAADPRRSKPVEPALLYISEHYRQEFAVAELAQSCSMSESYFRKVFSSCMGVSPLDYVNRYRVHRAINLLRTTDEPMQVIAWRCGFSSIAAFNRNFKRYAGMNPSAWRKEHRDE
ncbi:MAG: AraC family transcriptional regulator [Clostridia bacterium]|nr:AraC family transcriptional regulator [Clostridia bacterium]